MRKKDLVILVLCAAFLISALGAAGEVGRRRARESVCLSNVKRLSGAWLKYVEDHGGELVGGQAAPGNWVDRPALSGDKEQNLDAVRRGLLFPYVGDVRLYRCPAQEAQMDPNRFGWRTFTIAGGANGESWSSYYKAVKYSDLENPAGRYVFVEDAHVRGVSLGSWQMHPGTKVWVDPVGMWHDRKSTLGFADGHAETHTWHDQSFIKWNLLAMDSPGAFTFGMKPPDDEHEDIDYMAKGFPYKTLR